MESKIVTDEIKRVLENLYRKNTELTANQKIDYKTSVKIGGLHTEIYNILEENNFNGKLDDIISSIKTRTLAPYFVLNDIIKSKQLVDMISVLRDLRFNLNTLFEKPLPSVSVSTEQDPEKSSKPIDNMLYSYTPFKLRGSGGNYTILLLPSTRRHNITTKWCDDDSAIFYENNIKVLTPNSVKLTNVNDIREMVSIEGEWPFRLELDRRSPDRTYFCRMGWYVSPSTTCNRRECPLWEPCQGRRFWQGPTSFYSIGKVAPKITVVIDQYSKPSLIQTNQRGLSVETIEDLQAKIFIDSVVFFSSNFNQTPMIKLKETPGYKVNTRAISFSIDSSSLQKFVENLLINDRQIFAWVFTKYFVSTNFDVNDLRKVVSFFWNIIHPNNDQKVRSFRRMIGEHKVTPELVKFGVSLLLHSLTHLIHDEVVNMLQTSSKNLIYSFGNKPESDGKYRIFILENAERGLGLTQSYAAAVQRRGSTYLQDLADKINKNMGMCSRSAFFEVTRTTNDLVNQIWNRMNDYNRIFQEQFGITLPVEFARYILSRHDPTTSPILDRNDVSPYIDDILSATPLCWDGCYHCVRLETDCHSAPYEQMFGVSRSLFSAFLNEWRGVFDGESKEGKPKVIVEIGQGKNLLNYIKGAKKSVTIISPWFSKEIAKTFCELIKTKDLQFKILTSNDQTLKTHVEAMKIFGSEKPNRLQLKVLTNRLPHVKMIVIDDSMLIIGSVNLTLSGLYENLEGYTIHYDKEAIKKSLQGFESWWKQAELKEF